LSLTGFKQLIVHHQEDYFIMHLYKQSSHYQDVFDTWYIFHS